ncbi:hypothetical protein GPROT2_00105 [Gammaproteobacteria bacterium]|nr:hypothetical protein [Gammaproteobacteria bacterium]MCL4776410.1 hypothetical protein [Gammaproteobacteria bacterium]CAG0938003.1 hypothetical protein GPROT2_00105 [Gammaproteobacteria bacterium]
MGWVKWLKGLAGNGQAGAGPGRARPPGTARAGRRPGEAYASEWVKVLEDNAPARDTMNTYTWELQPDEETGALRRPPPAAARATAPAPRERQAAPDGRTDQVDPFDTYTWELHETDSRDDPWGLKRDAPKPPPKRRDGVNPYDTGIFDASWTGKFDKR